MVGRGTGVRVGNELISAGKINSLTGRSRITRGEVELRFGAIDSDGPTSGTAILKTEGGIKGDGVLIETDVRRMSPKPRDS